MAPPVQRSSCTVLPGGASAPVAPSSCLLGLDDVEGKQMGVQEREAFVKPKQKKNVGCTGTTVWGLDESTEGSEVRRGKLFHVDLSGVEECSVETNTAKGTSVRHV